jgi:hypothetical protein
VAIAGLKRNSASKDAEHGGALFCLQQRKKKIHLRVASGFHLRVALEIALNLQE